MGLKGAFCLPVAIVLLTAKSFEARFGGDVMLLAYQKDISRLQKDHSMTRFIGDSIDDIASNVAFYLYTRDTREKPDILVPGKVDALKKSRFNMSKPTKVLVHGFMDSVDLGLIPLVKRDYLDAMDVNVIGVDWSNISISLDYFGVAKKTGVVGEYLALLLDFLVEQGYNTSGVHVMGHSLGAHVAGSAGKAVTKGRIARITGLDPALPGFGVIRIAERLSKTDAEFVDCIHTCGGLLGIMEPFCQVDFYPNGGVHPQPGCPWMDFGKCSHLRSIEFFGESVFKNHTFPTSQCKNMPVDASDCYRSSVAMGNPVPSSVRGIYRAFTLSRYPFAPDIF